MKNYIILGLIITLFSCDKEELEKAETFEVAVVGEGMDCKLTLIEFKEKDLPKIQDLTGTEWKIFHAYNLDNKFNEIGQSLKVKIRKTSDDELFPCTMLGPTYPWVTILDAEEIN